MSALQDAQRTFASCVPLLITHAMTQGYGVRGAEWFRSREEALRLSRTFDAHWHPLGIRNSLHCDRLAIDLVLDIKTDVGVWRLAMGEEYRPLGEWWMNLDPRLAWGGAWGDPMHFSYPFGGRR